MKWTFVVAMAGALALAGCAKPVWQKPEANQQDYTADHDACMTEARQNGYGPEPVLTDSVFSEVNFPNRYGECMSVKGWYQETQIWSFLSKMGQ